jgi:hygromycin-B 7''-O-kinase
MSAVLRARMVMNQLGWGTAAPLERAPSAANEVWLFDDRVLRISATPGTERLGYEVAVARALPAKVPYPRILDYGRTDATEWLVTERVPGQTLSRSWLGMSEAERRYAVRALGDVLKAIHRTPAPTTGVTPPFLRGSPLDLPHQLPVDRLLRLIQHARTLRYVDTGVLDDARTLVERAADALDPEPHPYLVHGDLHLENVLWDGSRVTAVLDFEFARPGPADLDLDILLRFCADPGLHVAEDYGHLVGRADFRMVPIWLREAYPKLFAHPRLAERLAVYGLAYDVRQLVLEPPTHPPDELPPHHPYHRVRRAVEHRTHLQWMEW